MEKSESEPPPKRGWRKAAVASSVVAGMLLSGFTVLPFAVMNSSHRDDMLNARVAKFGLTVTSESGTGSWVTPVVLSNVVLQDDTGRVHCQIDEIRTSRTMAGLMMNGGDLGTLSFVNPTLTVALDEDGNLPPGLFAGNEDSSKGAEPDFAVEVIDADIILSVPWRRLPIVELAGLNGSASVSREADGRWLEISPIQVFDHARISESHTEQNLALVAPVLSQSTSLSGEMSVALDGLRLNLDDGTPASLPVAGTVEFHSVDARLKKDWVLQLGQLLGQVMGAGLPDRLQIARNSAVRFHVDERGIHHEGLAFLLPDLAQDMNIRSSGMVGLDESLDLSLGVQLPLLQASNPFMSALSQMTSLPFELQVKGTVDDPKLVTPSGFSLVDQASRNLSPATHTPEPPPVSESVIQLIGAASSADRDEAAAGILGGVLGIIRSTRANREDSPPRPPREKKRKKNRKNRFPVENP